MEMEQHLREKIKMALKMKMTDKTPEAERRYQTFKNILETAQKIAKEKQSEITDTMIVDAAKKEIKQATDLLTYCTGNDQKAKEIQYCISVAEELLPKMATEDEIKDFVLTHKDEADNIGAMMKLLKEQLGDALDGKLASKICKEIL
jgi:uncharacterized protein YqeY